MNKRAITLLLAALLFVLAVSTLFLFYMLKHGGDLSLFETKKEPLSVLKERLKQPSVSNFGDPIRKKISQDETQVIYEIIGSFPEGLRLENKFLVGDFIIKNDPLEREITVVIGNTDREVYFGIYEGSFRGRASFRYVSTSVLVELIEPGELVELQIPIDLSQESEESIRASAPVLETLLDEFKKGTFEYMVPASFSLSPMRLGVVR